MPLVAPYLSKLPSACYKKLNQRNCFSIIIKPHVFYHFSEFILKSKLKQKHFIHLGHWIFWTFLRSSEFHSWAQHIWCNLVPVGVKSFNWWRSAFVSPEVSVSTHYHYLLLKFLPFGFHSVLIFFYYIPVMRINGMEPRKLLGLVTSRVPYFAIALLAYERWNTSRNPFQFFKITINLKNLISVREEKSRWWGRLIKQ